MNLKKPHLSFVCLLILLSNVVSVYSQPQGSAATDAAVMQELKKQIINPNSLNWNDPDPCKWDKVQCTKDGRVIRIQVGDQGLKGSLPSNINTLTELQVFEVQRNAFTGPLPSFSGLNSLQSILLNGNGFTSIPNDFFQGMTNLQSVYLDSNPFSSWTVPESLKSATALQIFSAYYANITGKIPDFFGGNTFSSLTTLHLSFNNLEGPLPSSFAGSSIQSLWLNGIKGKLNGSIDVIQNMTRVTQLWFSGNEFTGPLPDFSGLTQLQDCNLRDNRFTGPVPDSLVNLPSLKVVNLTNNILQGPTPQFPSSVLVDMLDNTNSFCLSQPGPCDSRVSTLLDVVKDVGYPTEFAENWTGNDPCLRWLGITCDGENITVLNFEKSGLTGTISPNLSSITSIQRLILADNSLTGTIPNELTLLPNLTELDVSNNQLYGKIPQFKSSVVVKTEGNVNIGKDKPPTSAPGNTFKQM
ncbi:receptor protein kinase TMK1-like [Solanum tuberosum]|uniref:LRR receptor kinase n=1 Tax=Solanum tuberosum TaxID=4113 RepID=M1CG14_SOLTU|nr:PREDICTED: receptor protein kinase TMK1-like [Solanum tuberosum]